MKRWKLLLSALPLAALILEALPYGVTLHFASVEPERYFIRHYSYFSLTPYGYAVFGPFIAAVLTAAVFILSLIYIFKNKAWLKKAISALSLFAALASISPVLYGLKYLTVVGALITAVLLLEFILSLRKEK